MNRTQRGGLVLILVAAAGYAFFPIFTKTIFENSDLQPLDVLILRFLLAAPITWLFMGAQRFRSPEHEPGIGASLPRVRLLGMGVIFAFTAGAAFFALDRLPASTYTVIIYSYPAMVALFSLLLGDRLSGTAWLALGMTIIGIILTVPDFGAGLGDLGGVALTLLNAAFYATYIVLSGRLLRGHTNLAGASVWSIGGSFLFLLIFAIVYGVRLPDTPSVWLLLITLAVVSTVIPIFAFYGGMQKLGAARAAILSTVEPVFTLLLAVLLLEEHIQPIQVLGAAFILGSVILLQSSSLRRKKVYLASEVGTD